MPSHYEILGVKNDATQREIRKAYWAIAQISHPDKVQDEVEKFLLAQTAYEILSDPDQRRAYDHSFDGSSTLRPTVIVKENVDYHLPADPHQYDHYIYINELLRLNDKDKLTPGQAIETDGKLRAIIDCISNALYRERQLFLDRQSINRNKPMPIKYKPRFDMLCLNIEKTDAIESVFYKIPRRKQLYDLSLGLENSDEMKEIARLIGGRNRLIQYIKEDPFIKGVDGIFYLFNSQILTPGNFNRLTLKIDKISDLSQSLEELLDTRLLTQNNFNKVIQNVKYAADTRRSLYSLKCANLLTQNYFDIIMHEKKYMGNLSGMLKKLEHLGILNKTNEKLAHKLKKTKANQNLAEVVRAQFVSGAHSQAFIWVGPEEIKKLSHHIDKMLTYGFYLLRYDLEKGETAMFLALDLKKDLKEFFEKSADERKRDKQHFKSLFLSKLHSQDKSMTAHRERWKAIIGNIFIAFSGFGIVCFSN